MTPKRLLPVLITAACALAGAPAALAATDVTRASSQNWSGYVAGGANTSTRFRSVTATWTAPKASCTGGSRYSAFWVGLGGSGDTQALEQAGTEANCTASGQASYYAWYELVPKAPVRLGLSVTPGDRITTTVSVNGTTVSIAVDDQTTGQSADRTLTMSDPDVSSAEWIAEAPSSCDATVSQCTPLPLTDFGSVSFTGARATTTGGHTGTISDASWSTSAISLDGSGGVGPGGQFTSYDTGSASATPSSLSSDGSAFSVAYSASSTSAASTGSSAGGSGYSGSGYGGSGYGESGYGGSGYGGSGYGGAGYGYGGGDSGYGYGYGYGYAGQYGYGASVYTVPGY